MGNKASKVSQSGRVLAQQSNKVPHPPSSTGHTRVSVANPNTAVEDPSEKDVKVADRLKQLGQVNVRHEEMKYKPPSEDAFTVTLEARQKIEDESTELLEKGGVNKIVPPQTITAILSSIKEGDSPERIKKAYNLDDSILPKLQKLSLPEFLQSNVNELLDQPRTPRRVPPKKRA